MSLHLLVLAGGGGTRLWPLSRASTPKHLLPLAPGGATLLRATVERVVDLGETVSVVTAAEQADACTRELQGLIPPEAIIAEPVARGTGPALGLATSLVARADPEALIASVHADSRVGDDDAYRAAVLASAGVAKGTGGLATVGLIPSGPATGLGYIEMATPLPPGTWVDPLPSAPEALRRTAGALPVFTAARLVEKPDYETAVAYLDGGRHLWNLGLFAWPAAVFLDELRAAAPAVVDGIERTAEARAAGDEAGAMAAYSSITTAAVEPLVFERTARLSVVQATFPWSDLGSWSDLHIARVESGEADGDGNVVDGDALVLGSRDSTIEARAGRVVAVAGVDDLIVVDTPDALLVVPQDQAQRVKEIVEQLRAGGRDELL
ncbi:MAG: mannose-1-phosphate guanylyltransferase [Candidatus Dormibacteraeota bacterium]|nr:mannose-1-phosphate guanylyltransferase [Candidatus Dormibacteraeota bacterium]